MRELGDSSRWSVFCPAAGGNGRCPKCGEPLVPVVGSTTGYACVACKHDPAPITVELRYVSNGARKRAQLSALEVEVQREGSAKVKHGIPARELFREHVRNVRGYTRGGALVTLTGEELWDLGDAEICDDVQAALSSTERLARGLGEA